MRSAPDIHVATGSFAADMRGGVIAECSHYIAEEQPAALAQAMPAFLEDVVP